MGLLGIYDPNLFKGNNDIKRLKTRGEQDYGYGQGLVEEGIGGLRSLRDTYAGRLNDPLGPLGRSIFSRARGAQSDVYARTVGASGARRRQLALQSGGGLTPEQIDAANAADQRAAAENLFGGERDIAIAEAETTLSESSKLFDRMEGISRTIGGVGSDEKARGVAQIIQNLMFRTSKDAQKRSILGSVASSLFGAAAGGATSGGAAGGGGGVWGV